MTLRSLINNLQRSTDYIRIIELLELIDAECRKIKSNYGKRGPVSRKLDEIRAIALKLKRKPKKIVSTPIHWVTMRRLFRPASARQRSEFMSLKKSKSEEMLGLDNEIGAILKQEYTEAES